MQIASHPNSPAATPQSMRASPPIGALSGRPGFRIRGARGGWGYARKLTISRRHNFRNDAAKRRRNNSGGIIAPAGNLVMTSFRITETLGLNSGKKRSSFLLR